MRGMGMMKSLCVVLGVVLLSVACGAKKLWGVDVGSKEEKGEFESLLMKAAGQDKSAGGVGDEVGQALAAFADMDLSKLSLSELCASAIDMIIDVVNDEEWLGQFAEPGVIKGLVESSGLVGLLGDGGMGTLGNDDLEELLSLEGSPILYKTKFYELNQKMITKLIALRMEVSDPATLKAMIRNTLKENGLEREQINQVMEMVDNPEVLAAQVNALLSDPTVVDELTKAFETFSSAANMLEDGSINDDELMQMLSALEEDPEMMEQMYAELMKDPAFAEILSKGDAGALEGLDGGNDFFKSAGGRPVGAAAEL